MSRVMSASLTVLLMLGSASPLLANGGSKAPTLAVAGAPLPVPNYPGCPSISSLRTTAGLKRCNDTKTPRPSFTPLLDSLR